jgi:hypothetical protein
VGPRAGLDTEATGKFLLLLPGIEPPSLGRPVRSQTLYYLSYRTHNLCDNTISNLVMFGTACFSEQSTSVLFSLTRKITVFNFSYISCIIFVGVHEIMYYHESGSRDGQGWEVLC